MNEKKSHLSSGHFETWFASLVLFFALPPPQERRWKMACCWWRSYTTGRRQMVPNTRYVHPITTSKPALLFLNRGTLVISCRARLSVSREISERFSLQSKPSCHQCQESWQARIWGARRGRQVFKLWRIYWILLLPLLIPNYNCAFIPFFSPRQLIRLSTFSIPTLQTWIYHYYCLRFHI